MPVALRRLVLPAISRRRLSPHQPLPSFTGTGTIKAPQGHTQAADRSTIRSYGTEDAAGQEQKLIVKEAWLELPGFLFLSSICGTSVAHRHYCSSVQYEHDFVEDDDS